MFEVPSSPEAWGSSALHSLSSGLVVFHFEIQCALDSALAIAQNGTSQALGVSLLGATVGILASVSQGNH